MDEAFEAGLRKAGLIDARFHLLLCLGPDCCVPEVGARMWEYLKRRIRETGVPAMRTKAQCLRVCGGGPWLVVYPDGVWYGQLTEDRFERILSEHLIGGRPVDDWVTARNCLDGCGVIRD